jgi:hypothetical protein
MAVNINNMTFLDVTVYSSIDDGTNSFEKHANSILF